MNRMSDDEMRKFLASQGYRPPQGDREKLTPIWPFTSWWWFGLFVGLPALIAVAFGVRFVFS